MSHKLHKSTLTKAPACTELPPNKHQRNQRKSKPKSFKYRYQQEEKEIDRPPQEHEKYRPEQNKQAERCHKCGDTPHMEGFNMSCQ